MKNATKMACPRCLSEDLHAEDGAVRCGGCGRRLLTSYLVPAEGDLSIPEANRVACPRAVISVDDNDAGLWFIEGDGWAEALEPMNATLLKQLLDEHDGQGTPLDVNRDIVAPLRELATKVGRVDEMFLPDDLWDAEVISACNAVKMGGHASGTELGALLHYLADMLER